MMAPMFPVWVIDIIGSSLMIVLSLYAVSLMWKIYRKKSDVALYSYLLAQTVALAVFAVSRSAGHVAKHILITMGQQDVWQALSPVSGSINSITFVIFGFCSILYSSVKVSSDRISDLERTEKRLLEAEEKYRRLMESANDAIFIADAETGIIIDANLTSSELLGRPVEEIIGMHQSQLHPEEEAARYRGIFEEHIRTGRAVTEDLVVLHKDGRRIPVDISASVVELRGRKVIHGIFRDMTERKRAEDKLRESELKFRSLTEKTLVGVYLIQDGKFRYVNPVMSDIFGYSTDELMGGMGPKDLTYPEDWPIVEENLRRRVSGEVNSVHYEFRCVRKSGVVIDVEVYGSFTLYDGKPAVIGTLLDVTERKQAEEKIKSHLDRITALRNIDLAISASLDLRVTLNIFVEQVLSRLKVDAADVLLFNPGAQVLEYAAGRGFRDEDAARAAQRLGEGLAGSVALERSVVTLPELSGEEDSRLYALNKSEGFKAYVGVPLLAKGTVKGVLEIFQRSYFMPDVEWLDFLDALAGQAAIAIDNATLFDDLQRSNIELRLAYDTTIEGWSRALDYRDKETEGHSQRVTDMTLRIAREMGMGEEELVHVRRGALLHDIGKIGIPDRILHKPGKLTEEEWEIMKSHPVIAHKLLSPIPFLRPALDIPYCHHEKWDGTGYPHGLKGEDIPLAARIFAVVDVWDALRSDRPYRPAWSDDDARKYIESLAGKEFDPQVVDVFLKLKW